MPQHLIASALGVQDPLTYALVTQAIDERTPENETLDWKQAYPADPDEFAKDVAAFANSRSGCLVYGVVEDRKTSQAAAAKPVDVTDGKIRQLQAWANTRIDPPISGITITPLRADTADTEGFLVVEIPASPDMPHFIGQQKALGVPYRLGSATAWMRERDIERAYVDRFRRRTDEQAHLTDLVDQTVDHLDRSTPWLVAVASPTADLTGYLDSTTKDAAVNVLESSQSIVIGDIEGGLLLPALQYGSALWNPRRGLRRWIFRGQTNDTPSAESSDSHVELHYDGSVVIAEQERAHDGDGAKHALSDQMIVAFCLDMVRVITAVSTAAGYSGETLVKVQIVPPPQTTSVVPIAILTRHRVGPIVVGSPEQPTWSRDLRRPLPILATVPRLETPAERLELAQLIAGDLASQFGFEGRDLPWSDLPRRSG